MQQTPQTSNHKNHLNNSEKIKLLRLLRQKKLTNELQAALYQRGDQSTKDNGWAKYIEVTENWLYKQLIEYAEEKLRNEANIEKILEPYETVIDLGPWNGRSVKYMQTNQLYRPIDVSAYVIDHSKKWHNIPTEWTVWDWFSTRVFNEAQWKKAYIIGKTIPNLDDDEISQLIQSLTPTKDGRSSLVVSYFPQFDETQDNIYKLKAIYGDTNSSNPYNNQDSQTTIKNFATGLFVALWFDENTIQYTVDYDKQKHAIIIKIIVQTDATIHIEWKEFSRKKWEEIPLIQSRRMSSDHVKDLAEKSGWKRKEHQENKWMAIDIFEKVDPNKKQNIIKKRTKIWLLWLWLSSVAIAWTQIHKEYQESSFIAEKQAQIQKKLSQTYTPEQISYFNNHIEETKSILKTFYGIQDDGYLNGLIWPYMMAHPELIEYITQQKSSSGSISPVQTEISEYVAMLIMKDQENHNFLEYFGDDDLGYKKFDAYIPNMLQTLQYYDSIQTINWSYKINPNQEIMIPASNYSQLSPDLSGWTKKEIGSWISRWWKKVRVFIVSYSPAIVNNLPSYKNMIATTDKDVWPSDMFETTAFIKNFLSYRHQTKYLARQAAQYLTDELNKNNAEIDKYWTLQRLPKFEHIIQEYVLHGGETKIYLQNPQIGEKVFNDLILTNQKILKYFKDHVAIDLQTMQKFPEYEQRHGKMALSRWESSAYRNNPDYQEANKNFYKRD